MPKRSESRRLRSCAEVMKALDGPMAVSALTGARYGTVWPWSKSDTFPAKYFAVMSWALARRGYVAHPSLWDQVVTEEMEKAAA